MACCRRTHFLNISLFFFPKEVLHELAEAKVELAEAQSASQPSSRSASNGSFKPPPIHSIADMLHDVAGSEEEQDTDGEAAAEEEARAQAEKKRA